MTQLESIGLDPLSDEFPIPVDELGKLVDVPKGFDQLKEIGDIPGLEKALQTSSTQGLPNVENSTENARIQKYSTNVLPPPPHQTVISMVLEALSDHILILLIVAAVVSIVLGAIKYTSHDPKTGWIDGVAILVAVVIVVSVTTLNDYKNQARFRELNDKAADKQVKAIRSGEQCQISIFDVRVGDVIILDTGDIICADGVYIEGHSLRCDESSITGESDPIKKGHMKDGLDPFLISGSMVLEGVGRMLVTAVGVNSFNGKTLMGLRVESEDTPLQQKLTVLASRIGYFGLTAAVLLLLIAIPKYFIERKVNHESIGSEAVSDIVQLVINAITIVVVAVPEGLPLAVTMALAYGMMKMYKENNLVRHLASCETMGSATTICSDKTGTLTQNVMTVVTGTVCGLFQTVSEEFRSRLPAHITQILVEGIAINSNAYEGVSAKGKLEFIGSKTECALLNFAKFLGCDYQDVRKRIQVHQLFPFSSARKRMSVLVESGATNRIYTKGASEIILGQCTRYINAQGNIVPLTTEAKAQFENDIFTFASNALRTISLAYNDIPKEEGINFPEPPENDMIFIGIVGIMDPLRPEVPGAVARCQKAGITVRMVTGDNIVTATNIAKNCGILTEGGICMEGPKFRELPQEEMDAILPKLQVLARSSPTDKQLLVGRLKDLGEVVAVTGDGTNDGPALKLANVGFSMGIAGTEVAIAASDVVLLDDNFASIVRAVLWGRNIYDAICKFLQFQLTVNIVAVTIAFIGTLSGTGESPLTAVQLLWVNLIMDTLAALALATEPPVPELLDRPPNGRDAPLITMSMWKNIVGHAAFQLAILFTLLYQGHNIYDHISTNTPIEKDGRHHYTIVFNTFVFLQLFNEINARVLGNQINCFKNFFHNPIFSIVMIGTLAVQIIFVTFGGDATSTSQLQIQEWAACIFTGFCALPVGVLLRMIPIKEIPLKKSKAKVPEAVYTPPVSTTVPTETQPLTTTQEKSTPIPLTSAERHPTTGSLEISQVNLSSPNSQTNSETAELIPREVGDQSTTEHNNVITTKTTVGKGWQIVRQTHKKIQVVNAFKSFRDPDLVDVIRRPTRNSVLIPQNYTSQ